MWTFLRPRRPIPMLLYMPGVILSQLTSVRAEAATFAFAYAAGLFSLGLSARILPDFSADGGRSRWLILLPASLVLFVLPNDAFAQREYFAAAFALPIVAVFYPSCGPGHMAALVDRVLAAVLAGIMIAIKPPLFAIPGLVLAAFYWWRTRSLSFLFSKRVVRCRRVWSGDHGGFVCGISRSISARSAPSCVTSMFRCAVIRLPF